MKVKVGTVTKDRMLDLEEDMVMRKDDLQKILKYIRDLQSYGK